MEKKIFQFASNISKLEEQRLKELFTRDKNIFFQILDVLADIFLKRSIEHKKISLRNIDWFVLNYSKEKGTVVSTSNGVLNVYKHYLSWRRNYKRIIFAPYKREKIIFFVDKKTQKKIPTTVAQIHYFWFLIQENLLAYVIKNFEAIVEHQKQHCKKNDNNNKPKKRAMLTKPFTESLLLKTTTFSIVF